MAIVIKPITLEVSKPNVFQAIAAKQGDSNSRFLKATIVNEGVMIPVLSTSTVVINAKRNDGQSNSFFGETNDDGTATVPVHSWMLELVGYVNCDVSIIDTQGRKLTTTSFTLLVEEASNNGSDMSETEQYDFITEVASMVSKKADIDVVANAIKNTASGSVVSLTDISPIEHTLKIKATSDTIDISTAKLIKSGKNFAQVNSVNYDESGKFIFEGEISGDFILSWNCNLEMGNKSGSVFDIKFADGTEDSISGWTADSHNYKTFVNKTITRIKYLNWTQSTGGSVDNIQLEVGTTKTDFEPFKELKSHTINADGTVDGVTSLYPTTTLAPDTEGVVLDVEYNADTKKYIDNKFAELATAMINK